MPLPDQPASSRPADGSPAELVGAKRQLREGLLAARRRRDPVANGNDDALLNGWLIRAPELARLRAGDTVAGYLPLPGEPSPVSALRALVDSGIRVLLPVLRDDADLDWRGWQPAGNPATTPVGTPAGPGSGPGQVADPPPGQLLGPGAVRTARAVLVPGVAGDRAGGRLGRGGGSYDRALARLDDQAPRERSSSGRAATSAQADPPGAWTCLLLWPDELLEAVPAADHDQRVAAVATAAGILRVPPATSVPTR